MRSLVLALVALALPVVAQELVLGPQAGDRALLFSFNGLALGSFEGGLGAKGWVGPSTAVTIGIDAEASRSERDTSETWNGFSRGRIAGGLTVGVEFHATGGRFSPFVGVGVGAGLSRFSDEVVRPDRIGAGDRTSTGLRYTASARVGVGAEYRFSERFSISGRQDVRGGLYWGNERLEREDEETEEQPESGWSVGTGASSLTLGVYF